MIYTVRLAAARGGLTDVTIMTIWGAWSNNRQDLRINKTPCKSTALTAMTNWVTLAKRALIFHISRLMHHNRRSINTTTWDALPKRIAKGIVSIFTLTRQVTLSTTRRKKLSTTAWLTIAVFVLLMTVWAISWNAKRQTVIISVILMT